MLIAVTGQKRKGKDTVAKRISVLQKELGLHPFERRAFADPLKLSASALLGMTREDMDAMKDADPEHAPVLAWVDQNGELYLDIMDGKMTMRLFLQVYGTEAHREIPQMGDDFWVRLTLPDGLIHDDRTVVITDCRFPNEAQRVHELGGYVVEVGDGTPRDELHWEHESEKPLPIDLIDYQIVNDRTDDHFVTLDTDVREMIQIMQTWE
jgi:hypothetical protein